MKTTKDLKEAAATNPWFASELVRRAKRLGCDVTAEGPHFTVEVAAEFLDGWTVGDIQQAAS